MAGMAGEKWNVGRHGMIPRARYVHHAPLPVRCCIVCCTALHAHPRRVKIAAGPRAKAALLHGRALWLHGSTLQLLHGRPWRPWLLHGRPGWTRLLHRWPGWTRLLHRWPRWAWLLHWWPQRARLLHWWPRRTRLLPALLLWASWRWWPHATHGRRGRPHVGPLGRHARLTRVGLLLQGGGWLVLLLLLHGCWRLLLLLSPAAGDCAKHTACSQLRQSCANVW